MALTDEGLMDRAVHGDVQAFVELLKRYGPKARAELAGRISQRWQSVLSDDDIIQQTFADAAFHIARLVSLHEAVFEDWLKTTAINNLRDALKALETEKCGGDRHRVETRPADDSYAELYELVTATGTTPSGQVARAEAKVALERALAQLPQAYARVVAMYDLEGRPVQEVADALQRSPGAVYMLRARAHERLHELMGRTGDFFSTSS